MKKTLGVLAGLMLVSSIGFASPVVDTNAQETQVGFGISRIEGANSSNTFVQHGLTDKLAFNVEVNDFDRISDAGVNLDFKYTDYKVQYKVSDAVRIFAGTRDYEAKFTGAIVGTGSASEFLYGVGVTVPFGEKFTAFGTWQKADVIKDYQIGASYAMSAKLSAYVSYNKFDIDGEKADGTSFGLTYKF